MQTLVISLLHTVRLLKYKGKNILKYKKKNSKRFSTNFWQRRIRKNKTSEIKQSAQIRTKTF
jgi:hypothetical protein